MEVSTFLRQNIEALNTGEGQDRSIRSMLVKTYNFAKDLSALQIPTRKEWKENKGAYVSFFATLCFAFYIASHIPNPFEEGLPRLIFFLSMLPVAIFAQSLLLSFIISLGLRYHPDDWKLKELRTQYRAQGHGSIKFSQEQYEEAAVILKKFKTTPLEDAYETFDPALLDLLILAHGLMVTQDDAVFNKQWELRRMVSIKAIEKDTEAGWEE